MIDEFSTHEEMLAALEGIGPDGIPLDGPLLGNLFQLYEFSEEAEAFTRKDKVGAYLCAKAADDVHAAVWEVLNTDTDDRGLLRACMRARECHRALKYLTSLISQGARAEQLLKGEEEAEPDHPEEGQDGEEA